MISTSSSYKIAIAQPSRTLSARLVIGKNTITTDEIISISIDGELYSNDNFSLGGGIANTCDIEIVDTFGKYTNVNFRTNNVDVYMSVLLANSTYEEVFVGTFNVDECEAKNKKLTLKCFDLLVLLDKVYTSSLTFPATINAIVNEIQTLTGLSFSSALKNSAKGTFKIKQAPVDLTMRQVLIDICQINGGFLVCNRNIIDIVILGNQTVASIGLERAFNTTVTSQFGPVSMVDINGIAQGEPPYNIALDIPLLDYNVEEDLRTIGEYILSTLSTFSFTGFKSEWQGDFSLQLGDIISVEEKNITYKTFICKNKITFDGGLKSETEAKTSKDKIDGRDRDTNRINARLREIENGLYYYTNSTVLNVSSTYIEVASMEFATSSSSNLLLFATINVVGTATCDLKIYVDGVVMAFNPTVNVVSVGLVTLTIPLLAITNDKNHLLSIQMKSTSACTINKDQSHFIIYGQKVIGGLTSMYPKANVYQDVHYDTSKFKIPTTSVLVGMFDSLSNGQNILQTVPFNKIYAGAISGNVEIKITDILPPGSYEDNVPVLVYNGTWSTLNDASYSSGSIKYSNTQGNTIDFTFNGTGFTWYAVTDVSRGRADLYIDGVKKLTVDQYSADMIINANVYSVSGLSNAIHQVKIVVLGTKQAIATDTMVTIDKIVIN